MSCFSFSLKATSTPNQTMQGERLAGASSHFGRLQRAVRSHLLCRQASSLILCLVRPCEAKLSLFAIEDEDVWQALIQDVHGHGQGLVIGRNGDFASSHNPAFEFLG